MWTEEEVTLLTKMCSEYTPVRDIAKALNRSIESVRGKIARLKLSNKRYWTKEEDDKVRNNQPVEGRTEAAINCRRTKLNLTRDTTWHEEDDIKLKNLYLQGSTHKEISIALNRTIASIANRITNNKLSDHTNRISLSQEEFTSRVLQRFPNIIKVGVYKNSRTKVYIKYKCGHYSYTRPDGLLGLKGIKGECSICNAKTSKGERELVDFISRFTKVNTSDRSILKGSELDIVLPEYKLAIEYNGEYWHSSERKPKDYHIKKTLAAEAAGYSLIHIWEHDWFTKKEIIKDRIRSKLGSNYVIGARKCTIKNIRFPKEFLDNNHLQGAGAPTSTNIGMYYKGELVSVMTFSKARFHKGYEYELVRFCSLEGITVVGAAGRMFKYSGLTNVMSYCDRSWGSGEVYSAIGFTKVGDTKPGYFYYDGSNKVKRYSVQKLDGEGTEAEKMCRAGYYRCYDCGNSVWAF